MQSKALERKANPELDAQAIASKKIYKQGPR